MKSMKIQDIKLLLFEREKSWPSRDENWKNAENEIIHFIEHCIKKSKNKIIKRNNLSYDQILCIVGPMKSGTSVIETIFDNHPDLFVTPPDAFLYKKHCQEFKVNDEEYLKKITTFWLKKLTMSGGQKPFFLLGDDEEKYINFVSLLREGYYNLDSNTGMFHLVAESLITILYGCDKHYKYLVEKTPENEFNADKILEIFPNTFFLHVVRNPIKIIDSLKTLDLKRNQHFNISSKIAPIKKSFSFAFHQLSKNKNYLIVKYEDFIENNNEFINNLCEFLSIKFHASLNNSTIFGLPRSSNSMFNINRDENKPVGKIIQKNLTINSLTQEEVDIIVSSFTQIAKK